MVESGPELIDNFARNHGDFHGRRLGDFQRHLPVHVDNFAIRPAAPIFSETVFE
jgi:hypothetical protein